MYLSSEKISVTLILIPSEIICSIAGSPSFVAGIFTIRFFLPILFQNIRTSSMVASVECAECGLTSTLT